MYLARGRGIAASTFLEPLLLLLTVASLGCSMLSPAPTSTPPPTAEQAASADADEYVIGVPDLLSVRVWKHPDLSVEAPVRSDGNISIPLLGDVRAANETPESLAKKIRRELSAHVTRPNVTVVVLSPDSHQVTVVGGVTNSGPVPLRRRMGVLEAIAAAGGFTAWANKGHVTVIRDVDGERVSYRFNYRAYLAGDPDADIILRPGDVVVVPE